MNILRRSLVCTSILLLFLCLSAPAFAAMKVAACGPTASSPRNTNVGIPNLGKVGTPKSGVSEGWVLLYEDSQFQTLNNEVHCQKNKITLVSSVGEKGFNANPDCKKENCTKAVESGSYQTKVALKGKYKNTNTFIFSGEFQGLLNVHNFSGSDGGDPNGSLIQDSAGNFYGVTTEGGASGFGVIYELNTITGTESVLYNFTDGTDGGYPFGGLVIDSTGNLYGTTSQKGIGDGGTVYKLDTSNTLTILHSFSRFDGQAPYGGLAIDGFDNLYGFTGTGGAHGKGTVFKIDSSNNFSTLYNFTGGADGGYAWYEAPFVDSSGNVYGVAGVGGTYNYGVVFKVDSLGKETVLHSFAGPPDGCSPSGGVTMDGSGNLYGTTPICGSYNNGGTVWKLDTNNTETILYSFTAGTDGGEPNGGVTLDSTGNLYGLTLYFGLNKAGVLYKLTGTTETVLRSFTYSSDGGNPVGEVYLDKYGNAWGTCTGGGTGGAGTLWGFDLD